MTPLHLTLKNFTGIKAGMGLDVFTLDIENTLDPDARLIAIKGENGKGKSTVLDNLHPYRLMPSRAGSYSPASFSYYDNTYGDAEKVLLWEHDGTTYRSTLLIKGANKSKKTEAYLHKKTGDDWAPVGLADGKAVSYDQEIERLLGTPELFFTAVFAAQNRRPLADYGNADIKQMLGELLGLDHVQALGKDAQEVVKALGYQLDALRANLAGAESLAQQLETQEQKAVAAGATIQRLQDEKAMREPQAQQLREKLAQAKADAARHDEINARRQTINNELTALQSTTAERIKEVRQDLQRVETQRVQSDETHSQQLRDLAQLEKAHKATISECDSLLMQRSAIEQAAIDEPRLADDVKKARTTHDELQSAIMEQHATKTELANLRGQCETIGQQGKALAQEFDREQARSKLCDAVPCAGTEYQSDCQLLADAKAAADKLEGLDRRIIEKREQWEQAKQSADALALTINESLSEHLEQAKAELDTTTHNHSLACQLAGKLPDVQQADAKAAKAKAALQEVHAQVARTADHKAKAAADYSAQAQVLDARAVAIENESQSKALELQEQLAVLPMLEAGMVEVLARELHSAEYMLTECEAHISKAQLDAAVITARIETLREEIAKADEQKTVIDNLTDNLKHWTLLATALSKDGIIALSIDDAGPSISSICNDLLTRCYGPRFSVAIETQNETKTGKQREKFGLIVLDAEHDDRKNIAAMSGGERLWINECVTRAIALFQSEQSGRNHQCLFSDESDGALDPERKQMFMAMKKAVLDIGNYKREFMITHTPDLLSIADAVVDL